MSTFQENVARFHHLGNLGNPLKCDAAHMDGELRIALMQEELDEFSAAWDEYQNHEANLTPEDKTQIEAEMIDALVDLLYVTFGTAVAMGVNLDPFWDEVQSANLSKVDGSLGPPRFREDGKLLKPKTWKAPDIVGLLTRLKESGK